MSGLLPDAGPGSERARERPGLVPDATYRLQLEPAFGFDDAAAVVDYLAELGVSHAYCSPYLQAAAGSTHGYDIVDHAVVNEDLGGAPAHARFVDALRASGLGQVVDVVPNHMAIGDARNRWWSDVLEHGPSSPYAAYFDVDWSPPESKLRDRVLLPVLGDSYGRVLRSGQFGLEREGSRFAVTYFEHRFPLSPRSLDDIVGPVAAALDDDGLRFVGEQLGDLPLANVTDPDEVTRRHRSSRVLLELLERAVTAQPEVAGALDAELAAVAADPVRLHELLERQNYRLARWRTASEELDYRRFFDISTLAALRTEDRRVFNATHALPLGWFAAGTVQGFRVDHPDGLTDPAGYMQRLAAAAPDAWIVVEKILESREVLPDDWAVAGTTGYDGMALVDGLLVDQRGERPLTDAYVAYTGDAADFAAMRREGKREVLQGALAADVRRLTHLFVQVCEQDLERRDHTRTELRAALEATVVELPVYRTYVRPGLPLAAADRRAIDIATTGVLVRNPEMDPDLVQYLGEVLGGGVRTPLTTELCVRFQQLTGPAMAKGVEDTAFYRFTRLVSLNEVGSDPARFGVDIEQFHRENEAQAQRWPAAMRSSSTHDTKRSEDVRARLHLLAELPEAWADAAQRWGERCTAWADGPRDPNLEYLWHQTMVGAHPLSAARLHEYATKAMREAKRATSWINPDEDFEAVTHGLLDRLLHDDDHRKELESFVAPLVGPGRSNSLAQKLLTLTVPGVPDLYQGSELWTDDLVDPDNRRPVDYDRRRQMLAGLATPQTVPGAPALRWELHDASEPGLAKLWLVHRALGVRTTHRRCFVGPDASYTPIRPEGPAAHHAVAYGRGDAVVAVASRLPIGLERAGGYGDTELRLPAGTWRDVLSDRTWSGGGQPLARLLAQLPVALLVRDGVDR